MVHTDENEVIIHVCCALATEPSTLTHRGSMNPTTVTLSPMMREQITDENQGMLLLKLLNLKKPDDSNGGGGAGTGSQGPGPDGPDGGNRGARGGDGGSPGGSGRGDGDSPDEGGGGGGGIASALHRPSKRPRHTLSTSDQDAQDTIMLQECIGDIEQLRTLATKPVIPKDVPNLNLAMLDLLQKQCIWSVCAKVLAHSVHALQKAGLLDLGVPRRLDMMNRLLRRFKCKDGQGEPLQVTNTQLTNYLFRGREASPQAKQELNAGMIRCCCVPCHSSVVACLLTH
jgi:hypothetical protein